MAGFVGWVLPAAAGFVVAWVITAQFNAPRKHLVAGRLLCLLLSVSFFVFADCLVTLGDAAHGVGLRVLAPNILFASAGLTYAVFRYRVREDEAVQTAGE